MKAHLPFLIVVVLLWTQFVAGPAVAQVPDSGARVRATMRGNPVLFVGIFRDVSSDTLTIATTSAGGPQQRLLISSLARLEMSMGRARGRGGLGAVLGGLGGLIAGGAVGASRYDCTNPDDRRCFSGFVQGAFAGLVLGAFGGYLVGSSYRPEKWRSVNLSDLQSR